MYSESYSLGISSTTYLILWWSQLPNKGMFDIKSSGENLVRLKTISFPVPFFQGLKLMSEYQTFCSLCQIIRILTEDITSYFTNLWWVSSSHILNLFIVVALVRLLLTTLGWAASKATRKPPPPLPPTGWLVNTCPRVPPTWHGGLWGSEEGGGGGVSSRALCLPIALHKR